MHPPLSWTLLVPTYSRRNALRTSLELAVTQSRPPAHVIVVDASDDWRDSRAQILDEVAPLCRSVRWFYEHARVRSIPAQRNQGIDVAPDDGEVFFFLDDDSYMFPECAHRVMRVYEADRYEKVAGAGPIESSIARNTATNGADPSPLPNSVISTVRSRLRYLFERQLYVERVLLPYDKAYPDWPIPAELAGLEVAPTRYLSGMRMTFRAAIARRERFDETLQHYAAGEDMDASYRMSRHGALLNVLDARLFHAQDPSARLTRHTRALLGLLNIAYLYRRKGHDPCAMFRVYRRRLVKRLAVDVVRDLAQRRPDLPYARADVGALRNLARMLDVADSQVVTWYASVQSEILERNAP